MLHTHFHGHLTANPETKKVSDKASVTKFRIASNRRWTDGEGKVREETDFIDVEAWNGKGEVIQKYFSRGSEIQGHGTLVYQTWGEGDDMRSRHVIQLDHFDFCGGTKREGTQSTRDQAA